MTRIVSLAVALLLCASALFAGDKKEEERVRACGDVLQEILDIPENIPPDLLNKAECVVVIPGTKKFAIGVGGSYGRGAMSCRTGSHYTGPWSAPALYALEGANIGFQLGGEETDFVLLVVNPKGVESLLKSKVKLGADAAAATGPKGRDAAAATDVLMRAEILSYSRSRGLFAGISLEGSTLRQDNSANHKLYGRELSAREIISGKVATPAAGQEMVATLRKHSPKNLSDPKSLRHAKSAH
ncbi:MAG TPA: lipid-binding SYLF domain-containing protein [Terriglobales bacterium]|nr:lipid-binding SYLF domain-containing protein [Terriglobales bacterium]